MRSACTAALPQEDAGVWRQQRRTLARLAAAPVLGVRQHFLRMRPGANPAHMVAAGFEYDATWGFADRNGFRLGVADLVPAWDARRADAAARSGAVNLDGPGPQQIRRCRGARPLDRGCPRAGT